MKHSMALALVFATVTAAIYFRYEVKPFQSALLIHDRLSAKIAICGFQGGVWQCKYQASLGDWSSP
jgi:hypothetical protein